MTRGGATAGRRRTPKQARCERECDKSHTTWPNQAGSTQAIRRSGAEDSTPHSPTQSPRRTRDDGVGGFESPSASRKPCKSELWRPCDRRASRGPLSRATLQRLPLGLPPGGRGARAPCTPRGARRRSLSETLPAGGQCDPTGSPRLKRHRSTAAQLLPVRGAGLRCFDAPPLLAKPCGAGPAVPTPSSETSLGGQGCAEARRAPVRRLAGPRSCRCGGRSAGPRSKGSVARAAPRRGSPCRRCRAAPGSAGGRRRRG